MQHGCCSVKTLVFLVDIPCSSPLARFSSFIQVSYVWIPDHTAVFQVMFDNGKVATDLAALVCHLLVPLQEANHAICLLHYPAHVFFSI